MENILNNSHSEYISVFKAGQAGNEGNKNIGILKLKTSHKRAMRFSMIKTWMAGKLTEPKKVDAHTYP